MTLQVVQDGTGAQRPLILVYLYKSEATPAFLKSIPPNVCLVGDTEPNQNAYAAVPTLDSTVAQLSSQLNCAFSPVIIAGFSAGGFAVRKLLKDGANPDAVILADAVYGTDLKAWTAFAHSGKPFVASYSSNTFMEPNSPSPWRNFQSITGLTLPLGAGAQPRPANVEVISAPKTFSDGNVTVVAYPDLVHHLQGDTVLPTVLIPTALKQLGVEGSGTGSFLLTLMGVSAGAIALWWGITKAPEILAARAAERRSPPRGTVRLHENPKWVWRPPGPISSAFIDSIVEMHGPIPIRILRKDGIVFTVERSAFECVWRVTTHRMTKGGTLKRSIKDYSDGEMSNLTQSYAWALSCILGNDEPELYDFLEATSGPYRNPRKHERQHPVCPKCSSTETDSLRNFGKHIGQCYWCLDCKYRWCEKCKQSYWSCTCPAKNPRSTKIFKAQVSKLYAWTPKLEETLKEVNQGYVSHSNDQPIRLSRLDSPRGAYFILDGHHRVVEGVLAGKLHLSAKLDNHMPYFERTADAHVGFVDDKMNVVDFINITQLLFHGTRYSKISRLQPSTGGEFGPGIYLTSFEPTAQFYATHVARGPDAPTVLRVRTTVSKPFRVTKSAWVKMTERSTPSSVQKQLIKKGYDSIIGVANNEYEWQLVVFNPDDVTIIA